MIPDAEMLSRSTSTVLLEKLDRVHFFDAIFIKYYSTCWVIQVFVLFFEFLVSPYIGYSLTWFRSIKQDKFTLIKKRFCPIFSGVFIKFMKLSDRL